MPKPDIIYITTDQQYSGAMSCAGNDDLATPNMDRLAAEGTRFERAYCTYPLCTPSRASMFGGRMPHELGIYANSQGIDEHFRSEELGLLLRNNGYECAYGGKWHVPEIAMPNGHGFDVYSGFDDVSLPTRLKHYLHDRNSSTPLFLVASFDNPHNICEWRRDQNIPWGEIGAPPAPEECPVLPANFEIPPYEPEIIRSVTLADRRIYPDDRYTQDQWRRYRWAYFRLVELVDREIGRTIEVLEREGYLENALVIFSSDHGDSHGAHRLVQKSFLYEEAVRVPLIVATPERKKSGVSIASPTSASLDVYQTICDYAGIVSPEGTRGVSLRKLLDDGEKVLDREYVAVETQLDDSPRNRGRMITGDRHKYIAYEWGAYREQLFDLIDDPGEMVNLAVSARHSSILDRYRGFLREWCVESSDQFYGGHYSHPDVPFMVPGDRYPKNR